MPDSKPEVEYETFTVTTTAVVTALKGTVPHPTAECGLLLPSGETLKFWVVAEHVDDAADIYENLTDSELRQRDVTLEPTGGLVVPD